MSSNLITSLHPPLLSKEYIVNEIAQCDSLTIEESSERRIVVWDNEDAKIIPFHFLEKMDASALSERIFVSKDIPDQFQVDKAALAEYLWASCDRNAFITLEELVIIWSEPDDPDTFEPADFVDAETERLSEEYGDEYAYEIGKDYLGQLWFERNIVVINMGEVVRTAQEVAEANQNIGDPYFSLENQVLTCFLTTAMHELRHLQMETNIFLPEETYPSLLASEENVESYCLDAFENSIPDISIFPHILDCEKAALSKQLEIAATRADEASAKGKSHTETRNKTNLSGHER